MTLYRQYVNQRAQREEEAMFAFVADRRQPSDCEPSTPRSDALLRLFVSALGLASAPSSFLGHGAQV